MDTPPKILEISVKRPKRPKYPEYKYFCLKVVFKVEEEGDIRTCDGYSSEYTHNVLYEVKDPNDITLYWIGDKDDDFKGKIRRGLSLNPYCFLKKEKNRPGVYVFKEYIDDNPITRAAIKLLKAIKKDPTSATSTSRCIPTSVLLRTLITLDTFWD
jgi:hypothetical protein